MRRGRSWPLFGLVWLLLAGCVAVPVGNVSESPVSRPFESPVAAPGGRQVYRLFLPMWLPEPRTLAGKLGLAGGTPEQARALGASWLYDWSATPPNGAEFGVESVPMIGNADRVAYDLGGNSRWVLGFNEPDLAVQSNISPDRGAVLWREIEQRHPGRKLASPAVIDPAWLIQMRAAYRGLYGVSPRFDALGWHCYEWQAAGCIERGRQFVGLARAWGVPEVWCTEFAFVRAHTANPEREALAFVAWLEAEPLITRYAPYGHYVERGAWYWPDTRASADPSLFVGPQSLTLTDVGRWYTQGH